MKCILTVVVFVSLLLSVGSNTNNKTAHRQEEVSEGIPNPSDRVRVAVYMESQCPDTTNFILKQLWPTWTRLKDIMDVEVVPFGRAKCEEEGEGDFRCECQHQQEECLVNQVMNCVIDATQHDPHKYLVVVRCLQDQFMAGAPNCLQNYDFLDTEEVMQCARGKKGRQLHALAGKKTAIVGKTTDGLPFVPWILINGVPSHRAFDHLHRIICIYYKGKISPQACK